MRILYATAGFPYPLTSGYLRHYHLLRALAAAGHGVTLAVLASALPAEVDRRHVEQFARVMVSTADRRRWKRRLERVAEAIVDVPASDARRLRRLVARQSAEDAFDVAVLSGKRTVPLLHGIGDAPVIADLCDATSTRLTGMLRYARGVRRARLALELRTVERAEQRLARRAERLLAASERDATALALSLGVPASRIRVLPNGVDTDFWRRHSDRLDAGAVVFSGVMSYEPNVDAARRLVHEIMPLVSAAVPGVSCTIVGRDPTPDVIALGDLAGVTVTGYVDDVRPFLERAAVFAAPVRFGAGIQNKVLEAMSMEVPTVASPLAAAGLARESALPPLDVADTPDAFAAAIVRSLHSTSVDPTPHHAARDFVSQHFSWRRAGQDLLHIIDAVAERPL